MKDSGQSVTALNEYVMLLEILVHEKMNQNKRVGMLTIRENEMTRSILDKMKLLEQQMKV